MQDLIQDPFTQQETVPDTTPGTTPDTTAPANPTTEPETTKTVYVPEKPQYILGIESKTFFGIFYGALITIIFISIMEAEE